MGALFLCFMYCLTFAEFEDNSCFLRWNVLTSLLYMWMWLMNHYLSLVGLVMDARWCWNYMIGWSYPSNQSRLSPFDVDNNVEKWTLNCPFECRNWTTMISDLSTNRSFYVKAISLDDQDSLTVQPHADNGDEPRLILYVCITKMIVCLFFWLLTTLGNFLL